MTAIRWSQTAVSDLDAIEEYISRDSALLAQTVVARLHNAVSQLESFPESGRFVPERPDPNLRELVRPPYRIVYEIQRDTVHVLTIFHSARLFPDALDVAR